MLHGIHGSAKRVNPFREVRDRGTSGVFFYDFSEVTYPNEHDACLACHKTGTYYPNLPAGVLASTLVTYNGDANESGTITFADIVAARASVPNGLDTVSTPAAATCSGCHDSDLAIAHMEQNGGAVSKTRGTLDPTAIETCVLCHGAGRAEDVKVAHGF
jgi:OmcA/MtrC family decaheme c-type cytochrome